MVDVAQARYGARLGERVGNLVFRAISHANRADGHRVIGQFECTCGRTVNMPAGRVLNGQARTHCGCLTDRHAPKTHGMRYSREYSSWQAMKSRCLDTGSKDYHRWGGKGITVCEAWASSFSAFLADVGPSPGPSYSLDRWPNKAGNYQPGNVRWATPAEQALNRADVWHVEIDGKRFVSADAAASHFGVSNTTIKRWCFGSIDPRRAGQSRGGVTKPKAGCRMWKEP